MSALLGTAILITTGCGDDASGSGGGTVGPGPMTGNATTTVDPDGPGTTTTADPSTSTTSAPPTDDTAEPPTTDDSGDPPPMGCGDPPVWCPPPETTWHWQLTEALDTSLDVTMYDIDLFDTDAGQITALRDEGRVVICYFSAGSHEDWRPDADQFPPAAIGNQLDDWPGERWLDIRDPTVRDVLAARLDLAAAKGCHGVEPDNVDGYTNDTGFPLSDSDQIDFNRWLAEQSHARALSVGLKNDVDQVLALVPYFDWALDEECMAYDECDLLMPFITANKAVFHVEYVDNPAQGPDAALVVCPDALDRSFSTLIKHWDLDAWGIPCE